jgi:hypothetical protein
MRIQRFIDEPAEEIAVCCLCNFDEREINVYEHVDGLTYCAECLDSAIREDRTEIDFDFDEYEGEEF